MINRFLNRFLTLSFLLEKQLRKNKSIFIYHLKNKYYLLPKTILNITLYYIFILLSVNIY